MTRSRLNPLFAVFVMWAMTATAFAGASDTIFTYQGELKQSGSPASGSFDMTFSLWNALAGGLPLGSLITLNDVPVTDGLFTVQLDFGADVFTNNDRWLQIAVEGMTLSPRQPITRAPYAIQTRGIFVNEAELVGIGTQSPEGPLHVREASAGVITATPNAVLVLEDSNAAFINMLAPDGFESGMLFGRPGGSPLPSAMAGLVYNNTANPDGLQFRTGGIETRMAIESSGDVGIGTTAPEGPVHVLEGSAGTITANANAVLVLEDSNAAYINMLAPNTFESGILFGRPGGSVPTAMAGLVYNSPGNSDGLQLRTGGNQTRMEIDSSGNVGIGTTPISGIGLAVAGSDVVFNQDLQVSGEIFGCGGQSLCSDARFKDHVESMTSALETVGRLRGVEFDWRRDEFPDRKFREGRQIGFIAQEVQGLLPQVVTNGADGYLYVDYGRMTPLLVEAVKALRDEKDVEIAALRAEKDAENAALRAENDALRAEKDAEIAELRTSVNELRSLIARLSVQISAK